MPNMNRYLPFFDLKDILQCIAFKISTVTRLPQYVAINFVRFFYRTDKNVNAKILKGLEIEKLSFHLISKLFLLRVS